MRIGLLAWSYPPETSGLANAAREIAQALADAGHDVRVLTLDRSGPGRDGAVELLGCRPVRGPLAWLRRCPGLGHLAPPIAFRHTARLAHRNRPFDVIEATNWYAPGLLVALLGPAPLVTRNSTPVAFSAAPPTTRRGRIDLRIAGLLERTSARRSAGLISNTRAHGLAIATLYNVPPPGPRHAVIGLSLPPHVLERGRAAAYPPPDPPSDMGRIELLFIGRAGPRKGSADLLAALSPLADDAASGLIPEFHLTMVGLAETQAGPLPPPVRARLTLIDRLPEAALHDRLAASHVVTAPSRYESFGLVYQEAMAFGRPLLACAEDASARLFVGDTGAGLLADRCDAASIAACLRRLIAEPDLRARLHLASRAASRMFSRDTLSSDTLAAYRAALSTDVQGQGAAPRSASQPRPPEA